jgi:hypothetical protein
MCVFDSSKPYPSGHVEYEFDMHVSCETEIPCNIAHSKVKNIIIKKLNFADNADTKWRMTVNTDEINSVEEVMKIGDEIKEEFFDMLSLTLNKKVSGIRLISYNVVTRLGEGAIGNLILPMLTAEGHGFANGMPLDSLNINEIKNNVATIPLIINNPYIGLFRYAIGAYDAVIQFMALYLILYGIYGSQPKLDEYIMKADNTTPQTKSPNTGKPETIYTRLRNEITHRTDVNQETTRNEIKNHLDKFRLIVRDAVKSSI